LIYCWLFATKYQDAKFQHDLLTKFYISVILALMLQKFHIGGDRNMPLAERRKAAKLSQEQLANIVGVSRFSIIEYEKGRTSPTLEIASKIANALGCASVDELNPTQPPSVRRRIAKGRGRKEAVSA